MKGEARKQQKSKRDSSLAQSIWFGVGWGQEVVKNEAANAGGGQMVKGLEKFAIKFGLSPVGNGEPWTLLEKDNSATVWGRSP